MRRSTTRRKTHAAKLLLRYTNIRGTLAWPEHDLRFRGTITITHDGTITIATRRFLLTKNTTWVLRQVPGRGRLATWAQLRATTNDGLRLESDHVTMLGRNNHTGPRKATVALHGELSTLTVHHRTPPNGANECTLIYHTIGLTPVS